MTTILDERNKKVPLPDEFFLTDCKYELSYRFLDKDRKPISNAFGYRVIKYLVPECVANDRAIIAHTDVNPILELHSRDDLAALLKLHGDPWIPVVTKKPKTIASDDDY